MSLFFLTLAHLYTRGQKVHSSVVLRRNERRIFTPLNLSFRWRVPSAIEVKRNPDLFPVFPASLFDDCTVRVGRCGCGFISLVVSYVQHILHQAFLHHRFLVCDIFPNCRSVLLPVCSRKQDKIWSSYVFLPYLPYRKRAPECLYVCVLERTCECA